MEILFEYCKECKKHINQDVCGYQNNIFWVIDGATDVFGNNYLSSVGDVYWIVQKLNRLLKEGDKKLPLKEYVRTAINKVRTEAIIKAPIINEIPINKLPTYAICCVRYTENFLEYLCLGDCSLFVSRFPDKRYTDTRILPFHLEVNAIKDQYKHDIEKYKIEVVKKAREIKQYINVKNGYWIGTFDPDIVDYAIEGKINIKNGERFLICSDGFRPNIDEANFVQFESGDIFDEIKLQGILDRQEVTEEKYFLETGIDISDDRTVLLVEI